MVHCCAVKGCNNYRPNKKINRSISFFRIPKNTPYREAWLSVCSEKIKSLNFARICSDHFRPECFKPISASVVYINQVLNTVPRSLRKLKPDAIPTENLFNLSTKKQKSVQNSKSGSVSAANFVECCFETTNTLKSEAANESLQESASVKFVNLPVDKFSSLTAINDRNNEYENEKLPETSDNINNLSADEDYSETNDEIVDNIFSLLPKCNFATEEEKKIYLDRLQQVKFKLTEKMEELQKNAEKERKENERLRKKRREQCDTFLLQYLELKKSEAYWRKECFLNEIKLYCVKNYMK